MDTNANMCTRKHLNSHDANANPDARNKKFHTSCVAVCAWFSQAWIGTKQTWAQMKDETFMLYMYVHVCYSNMRANLNDWIYKDVHWTSEYFRPVRQCTACIYQPSREDKISVPFCTYFFFTPTHISGYSRSDITSGSNSGGGDGISTS